MNDRIQSVSPRDTIEVHLPDGRALSGPRGATAADFLQAGYRSGSTPIVAAIVNNELRELNYPINIESNVKPVTMADTDGARIYRRSLTFLLETAFISLFGDAMLIIDHSISSGGYYCHVKGRAPLDGVELDRLESEMTRLVKADLTFERQEFPVAEAIAFFEKEKYFDKV